MCKEVANVLCGYGGQEYQERIDNLSNYIGELQEARLPSIDRQQKAAQRVSFINPLENNPVILEAINQGVQATETSLMRPLSLVTTVDWESARDDELV